MVAHAQCRSTFGSLSPLELVMPRGEGGTPYKALYGKAPPERGTFFRFQVYERVRIFLFEVYERLGKSVIWVYERAQKG